MPIRPDLRHLYLTQEWASTRERILNRAQHRCEQCKKPLGCSIYTYTWQTWEIELGGLGRRRVYHMVWASVMGRTWRDQDGRLLPEDQWPAPGLPRRLRRVQLGVAHLDPAGEFYAAANLRLLCNWCHCHYDMPQHKLTRSTHKDARRPMLVEHFAWNDIEAAIARCDREIEDMLKQPPVQPAYLTTLGILDWEEERRILLQMRGKA